MYPQGATLPGCLGGQQALPETGPGAPHSFAQTKRSDEGVAPYK